MALLSFGQLQLRTNQDYLIVKNALVNKLRKVS